MSATLDTNVLLYASDRASPYHEGAVGFLAGMATGPDLLYLFWPTIMGYLRIATHAGVFESPLTPEQARANIDGLLELSHVRAPGEGERFWPIWTDTTAGIHARGNRVPDSHVVALMREHGVGTIWSRDRGLRLFSGIRVKDPFEPAET